MNRLHGSIGRCGENHKPVFIFKNIFKSRHVKSGIPLPEGILLPVSVPLIKTGSRNHNPVISDSVLKQFLLQHGFCPGIDHQSGRTGGRITPAGFKYSLFSLPFANYRSPVRRADISYSFSLFLIFFVLFFACFFNFRNFSLHL